MRNFFLILLLAVGLNTGCGEDSSPSFSLLPETNSFKQEATDFNPKIDILWVIDNSGSMRTSQENVADNFDYFIDDFLAKGLDFQMAVAATDSYKTLFGGLPTLSKFRDGTDDTSHTGVFVITPDTPSLKPTFLTNMLLGVKGSGDERAFQSFKQSLTDPQNAGFIRDDAFLAVIIVSDEDDFSWDGKAYKDGLYDDPAIHPISLYSDFLQNLKAPYPGSPKVAVSAIAIWDEPCRAQLNDTFPGRKIGLRYGQLVDQTGGIKGSLCGDFAASLSQISQHIIQLSTKFYLTREPVVESIVITVDGVLINQSSSNGWTYDPADMAILFHGASIPPKGANISVHYDPVTIIK